MRIRRRSRAKQEKRRDGMETGDLLQRQEKPPWLNEKYITFQTSKHFFECDISGSWEWSSQWKEDTHQELKEWKQKIGPLETNHQWERIKKLTNPYELIHTSESDDFPASICTFKPLSRSYFKMVEILQIMKYFEKLPKSLKHIRSAHVAEGPGGFIQALQDRAESAKITLQEATAMTLRPNSQHVPGWRRAFHFLKKHPEVIIHYGKDDTGNIYSKENRQSFVDVCSRKANFFTADGGFDFSVDYEKQEEMAFQLLLCSADIGLRCLAKDGCFVLKIFDMMGESTLLLVRLITSLFRDWLIYKPATSRPCNSERYLICRGYRGLVGGASQYLEQWIQGVSEGRFPVFKEGLRNNLFSSGEQEYLESMMKFYDEQQIQTLKKALAKANATEGIDLKKYQWKEHFEHATAWCRAFHVPMRNLFPNWSLSH